MRSPERREVLKHAEAVMARLFDCRRTTGANGVFLDACPGRHDLRSWEGSRRRRSSSRGEPALR